MPSVYAPHALYGSNGSREDARQRQDVSEPAGPSVPQPVYICKSNLPLTVFYANGSPPVLLASEVIPWISPSFLRGEGVHLCREPIVALMALTFFQVSSQSRLSAGWGRSCLRRNLHMTALGMRLLRTCMSSRLLLQAQIDFCANSSGHGTLETFKMSSHVSSRRGVCMGKLQLDFALAPSSVQYFKAG